MNISLTRRSLARIAAAGGVALLIGGSSRTVMAAQSNGIVSGGIGLTRTEFESYFGPGEATQSHSKYVDPTYGGPIYVGYDFANHTGGLLSFLELQWQTISQSGGMDEGTAASEVSTVLPADVLFQRRFRMGATPGGPISLRSEVWTSASLAAARGGKGSILVTYQEKTGQLNPGSGMDVIVTAATIVIEE